jgi:hypothetical protein
VKNRKHISIVLLGGLLAGPMVAQAQGAYDFESFNYPGSTFDQVFGINERGDAVGNGSIFPNGVAYVYDTKKGEFINVTPVVGFDQTAVLGISDNGTLVGSVTVLGADPSLDKESGLIIDQDGVSTVFDHPDALSFTQARGVNNAGLVTGFRDDPDDQFAPENGFIYDSRTDTFTDIVPSLFTLAQGINSRGDVVGSAVFFNADDPCPPSTGGTVRYGWLRTADGTVTYFDVNGDRTSARGITDSGTIAGFVLDSASGSTKGFVAELDGSQCQSITIADEDLLQFPGADGTVVGGIKNSGEVVGTYDFGPGTGFGFIGRPQ